MQHRSRLTSLAFALSITALGCDGSTEDQPAQGPSGGKADDAAAAIEAGDGAYVAIHAPSDDGCNMDIGLDVEAMKVSVAEDARSLVLETEDTEVECLRDDDDAFNCALSVPGADFLQQFADVDMGMTLRFESADVLAGSIHMSIDCEGDGCAEASAIFETELPCKTNGAFSGYRAQEDGFSVRPGSYAMEFAAPNTELSNCGIDVLDGLPNVMELGESSDMGAFTFDDGLMPFDCMSDAGSGFDCERVLPLHGMDFSSRAIGAWTDAGAGEGILEVNVDCTDPDAPECAELQASVGTLPCRAVHAFAARAGE